MAQLCVFVAIAGTVLCAESALGQTSERYSYKHFTLGTTTLDGFKSQLTEIVSANELAKSTPDAAATCMPAAKDTTICTPLYGLSDFTFVDKTLAIITIAFNHDLYLEGYRVGLTEKFGAPTITTETYTNGFGASFTGQIWHWQNDLSGIDLREFGKNHIVSNLTYYDIKLAAEFKKRNSYKPDL
jgi:hypothetical protein